MYAVIKTGGKQYRVREGDKLHVESLAAEEGDTVTIEQVLMIGEGENVSIGSPLVNNASVTAKVLSNGRGKKIKIIKFKRRKHYRRQMGHRQNYTELEITAINGGPAGVTSSKPVAAKSKSSEVKGTESGGVEPGNPESKDPVSMSEAGTAIGENVAASPAAASVTESAVTPVTKSATGSLKFLDSPNGDPDDLKVILGIGSVLEEKLNDMGIYHYSQIAEFSADDIDNVNTHLNFPGRIERDEWVPQAQELMRGGEARQLKYLDAPEGDKNDLKLISGVGPVLEGKLNELGIYHFWQIAKFESKDIDLVNDAMAFPGRIERDEWIAQAQNLADGGEPR